MIITKDVLKILRPVWKRAGIDLRNESKRKEFQSKKLRNSLEAIAKAEENNRTKLLTHIPIDEKSNWLKFWVEPKLELLDSLLEGENFLNYIIGNLSQKFSPRALEVIQEFFDKLETFQLEELLAKKIEPASLDENSYKALANLLVNKNFETRIDLMDDIINRSIRSDSKRNIVLSNLLFAMLTAPACEKSQINPRPYLKTVMKCANLNDFELAKQAITYFMKLGSVNHFVIQDLIPDTYGNVLEEILGQLSSKDELRKSLKHSLEFGEIQDRARVLYKLLEVHQRNRTQSFINLSDFMIGLLEIEDFDQLFDRDLLRCTGAGSSKILIAMIGKEKLLDFILNTKNDRARDNALKIISKSEEFVREIMTVPKFKNFHDEINLALLS